MGNQPDLGIVNTLIISVESILMNYEKLCAAKRASRGDLDRYEEVLKRIFYRSAQDLATFIKRSATWAIKAEPAPRVNTILRYIELGDSPEEAVDRYVLVNRHKKPGAHRE